MKIKHLFIAVLACAAFAACEKNPIGGETPEDGGGEISYLSVKIGNVPTTRAESFEYGEETENEVKSVRLYFFDVDGKATDCVASGNTFQNYFDFTANGTASTADPADNIEKKLDAVVVISTAKGDKLPGMVAAVINGPTDVDATTVDNLRKVVGDYSSTEKGFIMTSSVYAEDGVRKDVVELTKDNFKTSAEDAKKAPVDIYVERILAKVRVNAPKKAKDDLEKDGAILYYTGKTSDKTTNTEKNVYVKFEGWTVTASADKSYFIKNIDPSWTEANLFPVWTNPTFYRSYWAVNPTDMTPQYYTYNEIAANKAFDGETPIYCQENAPAADGVRTKIIVAAQLVDENGAAINLSEWGGFRYAGDDVKTALLATLQAKNQEIMINGVAISENDIEFKTQGALDNKYGHLVYAQLTKTAEETLGEEKATTANGTLKALGPIKYWKNGMTYYYTDIKHLRETEGLGQYGVVRNHIYDINISNVVGLGTPVYDPGETPDPGTDPDPEEIVPEKPEDEDSYLAAQINILSWRVVNQDVEL